MNSPADNTVPSYLMGDTSETLLNIKHRGDDSETGSWLASLVNDALEIATHGDAEQPVRDEDVDVMVRWVAQIFNEFELYSIEFNKKAAGSDLYVGASSLNLEHLSASNDHFEGHLSTRYWSLAFDASTRKLDVYLIPADLLLAFTTNRIDETEYKPFISFTPRRHSDEYYWFVDQQQITFDMLPNLAKELFGDLIKVASGNVTEEEFFKNAANESGAAAQVAADAPVTDRSYESEASSDMEPPSVFNTPSAMDPPNVQGDPGFVAANAPQVESRSGGTLAAKLQVPSNGALNEHFFGLCESFSNSIDNEMKAVMEFARLSPDDVELLQNCKQILIEMDTLRVATTQSVEKLRALQSARD